MRGFDEAVRHDFAEAGVAEFSRAARDFVLDPPPGHRIFVAESGDGLLGMIDIRDGSHIALFFVESAYRHRGIGSALLGFGAERCATADSLTVNAAPSAVSAYSRLGFETTAPEAEENGIRYVFMRKRLLARAEPAHQADTLDVEST
ncbi:MAG: GNAT family N-acetyltransferase [Actinomycetota bacterium]|nr:GNAT family N-acetyltransferase [Actinomycetota bacterium]